jgi:serine/threonine-protein kinase HipA
MNRCPITYQPCAGKYSEHGLKLLSRSLTTLYDLPLTAEQLRREAVAMAAKMSIQGVQPKVSARLNVSVGRFEIVDRDGRYILKPQLLEYNEVPENEDLTMRMAARAGIETAFHGLIYGIDGALTYFIKRFDRKGRKERIHVEDFAQLSGKCRETKYRSSMEQVVKVIDDFCTFPAIEKLKLFRLVMFCFFTGNEDMHLKNFSIIRHADIITLSPAYDLLNTSIVLAKAEEELALPLNGKQNHLSRSDLLSYFGEERLQLPARLINKTLEELYETHGAWEQLITDSFLSTNAKERYQNLLNARLARIYS